MEEFKHLMIGKVPGPSEDYAEKIQPSGDVGMKALMDICQRILDGK